MGTNLLAFTIGALLSCLIALIAWLGRCIIDTLNELTKSIKNLSIELNERINQVSFNVHARINDHEKRITRNEHGLDKLNNIDIGKP
jgi:hypothetical protein